MKGRAYSRFQRAKHKSKVKRLIKDVWQEPELAEDARFVGIEAGVHSRRCSCPMCKKGVNRKKERCKDDEQ